MSLHPWAPRVPPFALWDVDDVPGLVGEVLERAMRKDGPLELEDYEDARGYLLEVVVKLAARYDPSLDKNPNFGASAARILDMRVISWYRSHFGDARYVRCVHCQRRAIDWRKTPCEHSAGHEAQGRHVSLLEAEDRVSNWEAAEDDLLTWIALNG